MSLGAVYKEHIKLAIFKGIQIDTGKEMVLSNKGGAKMTPPFL